MVNIESFNSFLKSYSIKASCVNFQQNEHCFYYDLKLFPLAKIKNIQKYFDEISLMLRSPVKPNLKILHDQGLIRLEFILPRQKSLNLFDYFTNSDIPNGQLICLLGQNPSGKRIWMDLANNPHMIVAGTTGSGKSTLLHTIIANLFNYYKVQLYLIDPKNIEFSNYDKYIKYNVNVSFDYPEAIFTLDSLLDLMEQRFSFLRAGYSPDTIPHVVLIIDEFADLIMQDQDNNFYNKLCKLSQRCRAAKISIILSTQRPSVDVVSGIIKANFPARISCKVASHIDSKVILDASGAENLLGKGDALLRDNFRFLERFQTAFTSSEEVCKYFGSN